jgi:hypothetical protein
MSFIRWANAVRIAEYAIIALIGVFSLWLTFGHVQAVSLAIVGNSIGQGVHSLNFSGNVSASIFQGMNNSSWQVLVIGATGLI